MSTPEHNRRVERTVYLEPGLDERLCRLAELQGQRPTHLLRFIINEWFNEHYVNVYRNWQRTTGTSDQ